MTYAEKLKDPRWQKKRLEILQRDEFECQFGYACPKEIELHVHHKQYVRGRDPWDYPPDNFITVCAKCHAEIEDLKNTVGLLLPDHTNWQAIYALCEILKTPDYYNMATVVYRLLRSPHLIEPIKQLLLFQPEIDARKVLAAETQAA